MAFHVACPITCRRICFCSLGFPQDLQVSNAKNVFFQEVIRVEDFFKDPWGIRVSKEGTVQVSVPKVEPVRPGDVPAGVDAVDEAAALSAQAKRLAVQRRAAAAMVVAEDFARRVESGDIAVASKNPAGEEQGQSNMNVMCRMCFLGENEGSERARRMLSCHSCDKKYHRSCLKSWAQHRDLFHWSSWTCPYCRTCEVCRSAGDPTRLMFCKRCDGAYHCYCQHPSHKNVTPGPYLCPKHTRCHSCGSTVPGNGLSVRWFLGYTCCDACGRLFVKGNYCPVCLKVYRDSESTPMVCCDVCQRWVHCHCDGISDEKYLQFQVDGNLQYKCATCRGECYQVNDLEDAVRELWRRRDKADRDLIANLRAAAGLPTQEETFSISPYSDDEENGPVLSKNEFGRSIKFSLKGLVDKSPKKTKEYGKKPKKHSKKKANQASLTSKVEPNQSFEGDPDAQSQGYSLGDDRNDEILSHRSEGQDISSVAGICSTNQPGVLKHKLVDEVMVSDEDRTSRVVKLKNNKPPTLDSGYDAGKLGSKSKTVKAKKLVINLGARKINVTNAPKSDASSLQREQELVLSNGQEKMDDKFMFDRDDRTTKSVDGDKVYQSDQSRGLKIAGREGNLIKFGKIRSENPELTPKVDRGNGAGGYSTASPEQPRVASGRRSIEGSRSTAGTMHEVPSSRGGKVILEKQFEGRLAAFGESIGDYGHTPASSAVSRDLKPSLKFKFKKPNFENQNSQVLQNEEEKSLVKGQRSKRKRPSPYMEKSSFNDDEDGDSAQLNQDSLMDGMMDASWILKKLGKDAIGKRVEVHQASDKSWHKGDVTDVIEGTSTLSVKLDDGRVKTLELGKQSVRFVLQKQKRSKI
ncbi:hypothetical protein SLEP1_g2862 [Rubroshorea leprosula]|uniref:Uncharacterized protein n=1 Tax=Rubroshorea leprosula TaxID=152421 RepID=A0AAV5HIZ1_9ROSI|nr:hypothetical protein SLEP1_g2862 [Rubroshorea leprosula]